MENGSGKSGWKWMRAYPWQANAAFSIAVFILFWWALPALLEKEPHADGFDAASRILAFLLAAPFAIASLAGATARLIRLIHPSIAPADSSWRGKELKESLSPGTETEHACRPTQWSIELLQTIEWKRFEELCAEIYKLRGFRAETQPLGEENVADIRLYRGEAARPEAFVLCRSRAPVGVRQIEEFIEVLVGNRIMRGIFITVNGYTMEAEKYAKDYPITLITGEAMLADIFHMPEEAKRRLLEFATRGDYVSPTCPSCGAKMKRKTGRQGMYWGCGKCSYTEKI